MKGTIYDGERVVVAGADITIRKHDQGWCGEIDTMTILNPGREYELRLDDGRRGTIEIVGRPMVTGTQKVPDEAYRFVVCGELFRADTSRP